MKKYSSTITRLGSEAMYFLEEGMDMIILFNEDAPDDLADVCVLHTKAEVVEDPVPGDTLTICGKVFKITAVGDEALHTLKTLGHCTISFKGGSEPDRPGCIMVEGPDALAPADFKAGEVIEIDS